jgi:catechol 2,3-dioxygenase-like lactoylglutathione lyase family enzyme
VKIVVTSVFVDDQDEALKFYTEKLGFQKKTEIPLGEAKWLTVVSATEPDGVELLLEPSGHQQCLHSNRRWLPTAFPSPHLL